MQCSAVQFSVDQQWRINNKLARLVSDAGRNETWTWILCFSYFVIVIKPSPDTITNNIKYSFHRANAIAVITSYAIDAT